MKMYLIYMFAKHPALAFFAAAIPIERPVKFYFCSIVLLCLHWHLGSPVLHAQSYNTAAGFRLGTDWGLSVRQRLVQNISSEFLLQSSLQRDETQLTIMGVFHKPLITRRLNFYYGAGIHKGWVGEEGNYEDPFGLDFMAGLEFTIFRLNLTYDFKPALNLTGGEKTFYMQTGISLRYVMWKRDKYPWEQNRRKRNRRGGGLFDFLKKK